MFSIIICGLIAVVQTGLLFTPDYHAQPWATIILVGNILGATTWWLLFLASVSEMHHRDR